MANPVGRPPSGEITEVIAVRISTALRERLDRYVDLATTRGQGAKASRNSVVGYAIQFFLDAQEKPQEHTRQEPKRLSTPARNTSAGLRQKLENMSINRKRLITLLRGHPEGLSPAQAKNELKTDQDLGNIMKGMEREDILRRIAPGRYVVAENVIEILEEIESK